MDIFIKIMAFLLVGIGAFLVYGAKFIASRIKKGKTGFERDDSIDSLQADDKIDSSQTDEADFISHNNDRETESFDIDKKIQSERQIVNIKIAGMLFAIAGVILVLVAFN